MTATRGEIVLFGVEGIGEVLPGTDLGDLLAAHLDGLLADGDVVVVTSKIVSKAEGRHSELPRSEAIAAETVRVVARRGETTIAENRLGLVMAAAGVDASNVPAGRVLLLPADPDATAARLRDRLRADTGRNVAVLITDTAGRAWRNGQTDLAIGLAGLDPLESFEGRLDGHGNLLAVTAPAVADEIASAAELVAGKLGQRPVTVVRGLGPRVLPAGTRGPGARALLRPRGEDMFALGAREAVVAALSGRQAEAFGSPATVGDLRAALEECGFSTAPGPADAVRTGAEGTDARLAALVHAFGWRVTGTDPATSMTLLGPVP